MDWKPKKNLRVGLLGADVDVVRELMPAYEDIPKEFKSMGNKWNKIVSMWFFSGIVITKHVERPGIDHGDAIFHLGTIMSSWDPKHEHKEAAVAYLLSLWYDEFEVDPRNEEKPEPADKES